MGRKKISIVPITDDRNKQVISLNGDTVTFTKQIYNGANITQLRFTKAVCFILTSLTK